MSTSFDKPTSATGASPLDTLRAWAGGDLATPGMDEVPTNCLDDNQQVRLWNLLRKPSKPGLISDSETPR